MEGQRVLNFTIESTPIPCCLLLTPIVRQDARGSLTVTYDKHESTPSPASVLCAAGESWGGGSFVRTLHAISNYAVLRGLHYQKPPHTDTKLVFCAFGAVLDVVADLRVGSPTFGSYVAARLTSGNARQMLIPAGCAHGYLTLTNVSHVIYQCTAPYAPAAQGAIRWNDPDLSIGWGSLRDPILSDKDAAAPFLRDYCNESCFTYGEI